jgi:ankyrin repeat protein
MNVSIKYFLIMFIAAIMLQVNDGFAAEATPDNAIVKVGSDDSSAMRTWRATDSAVALRRRAHALIFALRKYSSEKIFVADNLIWVCTEFIRQAGFDDRGRIIFLPMDFETDNGASDLSAVLGHQVGLDHLVLTNDDESKLEISANDLLMRCEHKNNIWIFIYCIAVGADVNTVNDDGQTPLHLASIEGHLKIVRFLLESNADYNVVDMDESFPLLLAAHYGNCDIVELLISSKANPNEARVTSLTTPIIHAVRNGHIPVIKLLLNHRANIYQKDSFGNPPLHIAAQSNQPDAAQFLLESKADISAKDNLGGTALHFAAQEGHCEASKLLIAFGADTKAITNNGRTPLQIAVSQNHTNVADLLSAATAAVDPRDLHKETPLHSASLLLANRPLAQKDDGPKPPVGKSCCHCCIL